MPVFRLFFLIWLPLLGEDLDDGRRILGTGAARSRSDCALTHLWQLPQEFWKRKQVWQDKQKEESARNKQTNCKNYKQIIELYILNIHIINKGFAYMGRFLLCDY